MELALSVLGIIISLVIAGWEHHRANKAEAELAKAFRDLPEKLLGDFARLVGASVTEGKTDQTDSSLNIQHADLNGDGKPELLVSFLSGPHTTALQVFGMKSHWEFGLLGEIYGSTPTDFDLEDVNGDGVLEVSVVEISKTPDLPYVMGLRDRVSYKLYEEGFVEVKRVKCYTAEDLRLALASWHSDGDA